MSSSGTRLPKTVQIGEGPKTMKQEIMCSESASQINFSPIAHACGCLGKSLSYKNYSHHISSHNRKLGWTYHYTTEPTEGDTITGETTEGSPKEGCSIITSDYKTGVTSCSL